MLDPAIYTAMVVVAAWLIKLGFEALGWPLDEAQYNTLAGIVVAALLALFGVEVVRKAKPSIRSFFHK